MAKIVRYNGNLVPFASASLGTERTIFGEVTQADDITSQFTADFLRGWGIVSPSDQPTLQDFNAVSYTHGQILSYLHQVGMPEYNATQEYHLDSLCNSGGVIYKSLINTNVGNTPASSPAQWSELYQPSIVGESRGFRLTSAPSGWLKENGAAVSRTTYAALFQKLVTDAGYTAQTFTVTIASPGLFTKTAHGFAGGERLRLSTTGALPTGLNTSTDYFVEVAGVNTFWLQSLDGSRIVTTGTQSGVHSYLQSWFGLGDGSTTFNVPDMRGEFSRGWDDARGIDSGRQFGSRQLSTILSLGDPVATGSSVSNLYNSLNDDSGAFRGRINSDGQPPPLNGIVALTIASTGSSSADSASTYIRPRNIPVLYCIKY